MWDVCHEQVGVPLAASVGCPYTPHAIIRTRDLSISAIFASVEAVREGLLEGGVLLGGPPRLRGKCAPTQLLSIFFKLFLRT